MKTIGKVILSYSHDSPSRCLERFIPPFVAEDLGLEEVMVAVVLDGKPLDTISKIGRRRRRVAASQRDLKVRFR